jgi:superfamily II DNA or RNA helicase
MGLECRILMATIQNKLDGLEGFERLDVGELYYIGNRQFVEQGLAYYRNFAVEGLEWNASTRRLTASVAGSGMEQFDVWLQLRSGRLEHACDCLDWVNDGGCKHVVAATAAMFLAVQGKSVGGADMPPDYAQDLRKQLGYRDVGGTPATSEHDDDEPECSELWLTEIREQGNLDFQIQGSLPADFLRSVGVTLPSSYGFSVVREFSLNLAEVDLAHFLAEAKAQEVVVQVGISGDNQKMELRKELCSLRVVYNYVEDEVSRQLCFANAKQKPLLPYALIPRSPYVILTDGTVRKVRNLGGQLAGDLGPMLLATDPESFNESVYRRDFQQMLAAPKAHAFLVDGESFEPDAITSDQVKVCLNLNAVENAAGERESLEYDLFAKVGELELDLFSFQTTLMKSVTDTAFGTLLSAKRRVRALMDLIRRVLSANQEGRIFDLHESLQHFPELLSDEYEGVVRQIVENVCQCSGNTRADSPRLVLDDLRVRWLACQIPFSKVSMLLFSMFDAVTRDDLKGLGDGVMPLSRHESSDGVLQRLVSVCAALGVQVRFNDKAIRSAPLTINLQGSHGAAGKDIDWFELHPSITCADRSITAAEWKRLINGQLFLESADGSLIMPQVGEGEADGLQMIAEVLQRGNAPRSISENDGEGRLQISRLEMLDWIALRRKGVRLELPESVEAVFESLQQFDGLQEFVPPESLQVELRPYQKEGCAWIEFLYRHRFGACLADDMGLGKTVQTIAFLASNFEQARKVEKLASVLIVVPPSLVFNWLDEFERFLPHVKVVDCLSRSAWQPALQSAQVILTTYDRVRIEAKTMEEHEFDIVVFDEAHNLKNVSTARTKAAAKLNRRFTLCLTGTPVENNVSEFYSVLTATVPGIFGALKDFKDSYREHPERTLRRAAPFILRRTKDKILKELPKKEEHELFLEMSPMQKEIYTRTISEVREEVALAYEDRPEQQAGIVALAAILRLRQVCVSPALLGKPMSEPAPKFSHMADQLEELQAEGNAALVFSQFIGGLDQMEAVAKERGISYLRMDGRTPVSQRKDLVRRFQSEDGPSFFLISLKTGGVGLNLTRANYVFHLDPWWNPAVENQASDRAHRIGQTRSVYVQRLIMKHTIEARMLELKAQKAELFRQLVEEPGGKSASASLNRTDFDYLLNGD